MSEIFSSLLLSYALIAVVLLYLFISKIRNIGIVDAWSFFSRRYDFLYSRLKLAEGHMFEFFVLQHRVVAVSGEQSRKDFFNSNEINFNEGYKILMGTAPAIPNLPEYKDTVKDSMDVFLKRLHLLLKKERVDDMLPSLLADVAQRVTSWGEEGIINPFENIYEILFQLTVRLSTCAELADNYKEVDRLRSLYWDIEYHTTTTSLLLPWLPSKAKFKKMKATIDLYKLLLPYIEKRRTVAEPTADAIDQLLSVSENPKSIIQTIIGIIFAGFINTGMTTCWALIYLGNSSKWRGKVIKEIQAVLAAHTNTISAEPLHMRLATIPVRVWEENLPSLDLVIRETIRLTLIRTALRRNLKKEFDIAGTTVVKGDFLAYLLADAHLNEDIYSNPEMFDPDRYGKGREEDKKETYAYLGWGVGRHPCAGMRVAKLEIKIVLCLLLIGYDYELVNKHGRFPQELPKPDRNDTNQARPVGEPCFLKFRKVVN